MKKRTPSEWKEMYTRRLLRTNFWDGLTTTIAILALVFLGITILAPILAIMALPVILVFKLL